VHVFGVILAPNVCQDSESFVFKFSKANSKYPAQDKYFKSRFLNLIFPVVLLWFFKSILVPFFRFLLCANLCCVPIFYFACPISFWTLSSCVISLNPIVVVLSCFLFLTSILLVDKFQLVLVKWKLTWGESNST